MTGSKVRSGFGFAAALLVGIAVTLVVLPPRPDSPPPATIARDVPLPATAEMQVTVAELIDEASAAAMNQPDSGAAWGRLGMTLDAHHLYRDAATCYRRAHELDPTEFRWMYFLAIVDDHEGAPPETTVQRFRAAATIDPDYAPQYAHLGQVEARSGRLAEARLAYARALELAPRYPIARRGLGQTLLALGDVHGAVRHLEEAARVQDGDRGTYASLAQAYRRLGRADDARQAAEKSRRLDRLYTYLDRIRGEVGTLGVSSTVVMVRARFRMSTGQYAQAIADLKVAERTMPDDPWIHAQLGAAYREVGEHELAERHADKAQELQEGTKKEGTEARRHEGTK